MGPGPPRTVVRNLSFTLARHTLKTFCRSFVMASRVLQGVMAHALLAVLSVPPPVRRHGNLELHRSARTQRNVGVTPSSAAEAFQLISSSRAPGRGPSKDATAEAPPFCCMSQLGPASPPPGSRAFGTLAPRPARPGGSCSRCPVSAPSRCSCAARAGTLGT